MPPRVRTWTACVHHPTARDPRYARFSWPSPVAKWGPEASMPGTRPGTRPGMSTRSPQGASQVAQDLRPDGDHSDEQRQRGERGGFLNDDFEHDFSPGTEREHSSV